MPAWEGGLGAEIHQHETARLGDSQKRTGFHAILTRILMITGRGHMGDTMPMRPMLTCCRNGTYDLVRQDNVSCHIAPIHAKCMRRKELGILRESGKGHGRGNIRAKLPESEEPEPDRPREAAAKAFGNTATRYPWAHPPENAACVALYGAISFEVDLDHG